MKKLSAFAVLLMTGVFLIYSCSKNNSGSTKTDTVFKTIDTPDIKTGLLLYLPFNGSIADSSGNNLTTTAFNGGTLTYEEHGFANHAFGSPGNNTAVLVSNNGAIKMDTAFSISLDFMVN